MANRRVRKRRRRRKRPKLVKQGTCADRYHQLFMQRLDREGKYIAFQKRRSELYHSDEFSGSWKGTWWPIAREFGFVSKADEVARFERYMLYGGARTKMQEELRALQEDIKREQADERVEALPDAKSLDLPEDIAWVYAHPAMARACEGIAELQSEDLSGAPNKGAAGLLLYAMNNKRDFYKMVIAHLSKKDVQGQDDKVMEDDLRDIKEIEAMLSQI